jgi:hypothetical protein
MDVGRLKFLLDYDPDTGVFTWSNPTSARVRKGGVAGTISRTNGYRYIRLDRRNFPASALAWAYVTGEFPDLIVDHINRNQADDRWENLRLADPTQSNANRAVQKCNQTGLKGAQIEKRTGRFTAKIKSHGRSTHLGTFDTADEAHRAYLVAAKEKFGDYAFSV